MSESESAVDRRGNCEEDDCPICLKPLPPFWDLSRRSNNSCCDKEICRDCHDKKVEFVDRAIASGSYGKEEDQLNRFCPLCRAEMPVLGEGGRLMLDRYEKGQLPLKMYCSIGKHCIYGTEGVQINNAKGLEILLLGAEEGDPNCQHSIGTRYAEGREGLPKSLKEAKRWLLAATEQGHAIAEYNLAMMYENEGNDAECLRHLRGSALKGYDGACQELGEVYYFGRNGVQQSFEEAIRVLTPAAERGDAASMTLLGSCMVYPDLRSVLRPAFNPNFTKGLHWLRRASEEGEDGGGQKAKEGLSKLEQWASYRCFMCNEEAPAEKAFLRCSRCRAAWYCSKDCQIQHWKAKVGGHKPFCTQWCPQK